MANVAEFVQTLRINMLEGSIRVKALTHKLNRARLLLVSYLGASREKALLSLIVPAKTLNGCTNGGNIHTGVSMATSCSTAVEV